VKVVLVSRFPRVDTPGWKRRVAHELEEAGMDLALLYSRARLVDQAMAGLREEGVGLMRRYLALRRGAGGAAGSEPALSLAAWGERRGIPIVRARRLGDADALRALRDLEPDLLVLAGADIVPAAVLDIPRLGTINPHYGLLPTYRGMNVTEWSVLQRDPVGVTVHMVDPGIDTGAILLKEVIDLEPGETFASLRRKHQDLAARLLVRAATGLRDGTIEPTPQAPEDGRQYYRMHPRLLRLAEKRLEAQAAMR
jgi:methionyl-tRNA formyltransferase